MVCMRLQIHSPSSGNVGMVSRRVPPAAGRALVCAPHKGLCRTSACVRSGSGNSARGEGGIKQASPRVRFSLTSSFPFRPSLSLFLPFGFSFFYFCWIDVVGRGGDACPSSASTPAGCTPCLPWVPRNSCLARARPVGSASLAEWWRPQGLVRANRPVGVEGAAARGGGCAYDGAWLRTLVRGQDVWTLAGRCLLRWPWGGLGLRVHVEEAAGGGGLLTFFQRPTSNVQRRAWGLWFMIVARGSILEWGRPCNTYRWHWVRARSLYTLNNGAFCDVFEGSVLKIKSAAPMARKFMQQKFSSMEEKRTRIKLLGMVGHAGTTTSWRTSAG